MSPRSRSLLLRVWRPALVMAIVVLIRFQTGWLESQNVHAVSLEDARLFFPSAAQVLPPPSGSGLYQVLNARDDSLGALLTTSPETDSIIGYSGPTNLLVGLDTTGAVEGIRLLRSGDTPEHVELVLADPAFLQAFVGWKPGKGPPPKIAAVTGATLTSYAIAESLAQRLSGSRSSLRFAYPVTLADVRKLFPTAETIEPAGSRWKVLGAGGKLLGQALRTSPAADNVSGYSGPTETLVALSPDGDTVTGLHLLKSYDTLEYVDNVRTDKDYLGLFAGRTVGDLARLDFEGERIEGVSGATKTSWAVAESLKRRLAAELAPPATPPQTLSRARDWALAATVAGALALAFTSLRGNRWIRLGWQALMIGYIGLAGGGLLSLSLFGGWAAHGPALRAAPGLLLLGLAALVIPWASRRQLYCHQICPHGAAQQWLGMVGKKLRFRKKTAPAAPPGPRPPRHRAATLWEALPAVLLCAAVLALLLGLPLRLAGIEPFDAWVWHVAGTATLAIAAIGLAASVFVPQAYCRFGCPTGAVFSFVRSSGHGDHWGSRDWAALALLAAGLLSVGWTRLDLGREQPAADIVALGGKAMGSTWSVKIRGPVPDPAGIEKAVAGELERIEQIASTWRADSSLSLFNASRSTEPVPVPADLVRLARQAREVSQASGGAFDITVGPLVRLWGFGPGPRRESPPSESEIKAVRSRLGWRGLTVADHTLAKASPEVEADVSALTEGWAADQVTALLKQKGFHEFLVEISGEIRVAGTWPIAIEHPLRTCVLHDEAIATSGTYRQNWKAAGHTYSHLLDARTGRPVTHDTVTVSVRHPDCMVADAWSTAFNVLGYEMGLPIADRLGLAVQFVTEGEGTAPQVHSSAAWK